MISQTEAGGLFVASQNNLGLSSDPIIIISTYPPFIKQKHPLKKLPTCRFTSPNPNSPQLRNNTHPAAGVMVRFFWGGRGVVIIGNPKPLIE